jgi:hypothetical protein
MEPETRKEIWAVLQTLGSLYCCFIGTWAIFHPAGTQTAPIQGATSVSPHLVWWQLVLISGFAICAVSLAIGAIATFVSIVRSKRDQPGHGKPKWQKLQWAYAERERLEVDLRKCNEKLAEATKPNDSLRARTIAVCDQLKEFRVEHGPMPTVEMNSRKASFPSNSEECIADVWAQAEIFRAKMGADYRIGLRVLVRQITDEIYAHSIFSEDALNKAIQQSESQECTPESVEIIRKELWKLALNLDK